MSELIQSITFAALGGLLYDSMILYKDYKMPKENRVKKDAWYWFFMCLWPCAGIILVWAYTVSGSQLNGFPALMTGFTASTTLQTSLDKTLSEQKTDNDIE